jgi:hypothetical protein
MRRANGKTPKSQDLPQMKAVSGQRFRKPANTLKRKSYL